MSGQMSLPAAPQAVPGLPENFTPILFDGFNGLNTKSTRFAIPDDELYWCDGFMPFGKNTLRSMPGINTGIYTAPVGRTIICFRFFNIGTGVYLIAFLDDGSAEIYQNVSNVWTVVLSRAVLVAGTFAIGTSATYTNPYAQQWGNQYLLIVASNGYFIFDGTVLYQGLATTATLAPGVKISNGGSGYASAPTVTVAGGTGSGATFTATISGGSVIGVTITNAGGAYAVTDGIGAVVQINIGNPGSGGTNGTGYALTITRGTGDTTGAGATGTYDIVGGAVTNIKITNAGAAYTVPPTVTFPLGAVVGATATAVLGISPNYYQPTLPLKFTGGGGTGAAATVNIMPIGISGSAIETYAQRVWIANTNKIFFTAASSPTDFATTDGGGIITSTDSFLKTSYINLFQSNGFLYVLADSSVNYISGVTSTTSGSGLGAIITTTFSNVNVDPQIGTFARDSCQTFGRRIVFLSSDGLHIVNGGVVQKISDNLDGIFQNYTASTFTAYAPSSAQAVIWGVHCYMVLLPLTNPFTNVTSYELVLWDGKKWWSSPQDQAAYGLGALKFIGTFEYDSNISAYGTDGAQIFQLCSNYSTSTLTKTVSSKLYDTPSFLINKTVVRMLGLANQAKASAPALTIALDNANTSQSYSTSALADPRWTVSGQKWFTMDAYQQGYMLGFTITTTESNITLQSFMMINQQYNLEI